MQENPYQSPNKIPPEPTPMRALQQERRKRDYAEIAAFLSVAGTTASMAYAVYSGKESSPALIAGISTLVAATIFFAIQGIAYEKRCKRIEKQGNGKNEHPLPPQREGVGGGSVPQQQ